MIEGPQGIITHISKRGEDLFAHIPRKQKEHITRGDKVKITIIEENHKKKDSETINREIKEFINNPNGEKIKTSINGYNITIPWNHIIEIINKKKLTAYLKKRLNSG